MRRRVPARDDGDLEPALVTALGCGPNRERIRERYNGYNWRGGERVYNPYDILHFFNTRDSNAHWFGTTTPRFLIGRTCAATSRITATR